MNTTKRNSPRYRVTPTLDGCALHILTDCALGGAGEIISYSREGVYVTEIDSDGNRVQVCDNLYHRGPTLKARTPLSMVGVIRREAARRVRIDADPHCWDWSYMGDDS